MEFVTKPIYLKEKFSNVDEIKVTDTFSREMNKTIKNDTDGVRYLFEVLRLQVFREIIMTYRRSESEAQKLYVNFEKRYFELYEKDKRNGKYKLLISYKISHEGEDIHKSIIPVSIYSPKLRSKGYIESRVKEAVRDLSHTSGLFISVMKYIQQISEAPTEVKERLFNKKRTETSVSTVTKSLKANTTCITKASVYKLIYDPEFGDYIKKEYQRHVSEWGRRGHWRTYKNGKKVWIKSTTCKVKKNDATLGRKNKTYLIPN